ncbi:AtpZ/AtpI family protein [Kaistella daneshvariae]|uniref:AtpZ/AtpI family protein n=1 Tax=Kaistella daneshvariae TaxID=2487074 RepID=A0ABM7C5J6_9FLAO|nr:AtpZ/AtpI family protein [Kaistella daneshvariae]AZI66234.1 AtpZ/AtpI family protein [Kaistella daneshvariae]
MAENPENKEEKNPETEKDYGQGGLRQYGVYSSIVFQMLATMGLGFWGGKKINDHFGLENNLLTVAIGFIGMGLAFYNLLRQLNNIQNK